MYVIKLDQIETRYKYIAVIKPLYEILHDWFMEHNYKGRFGGDKYMETLYYLDESQSGYNYWIWWRLFKTINSQIRFFVSFDMLALAVQDVQVIWQGKKYKAQKAEFTFFINAQVQVDYNNQWEKYSVIKPFINVMLKRILKQNLEAYKRILERDMKEVQAVIKNYFGIYQYYEEREAYHPFRGYGY